MKSFSEKADKLQLDFSSASIEIRKEELLLLIAEKIADKIYSNWYYDDKKKIIDAVDWKQMAPYIQEAILKKAAEMMAGLK